jgi:hypothetical protein
MALIIIAFGCEIRDGTNHSSVVTWLNANATSAATDRWTYPKAKTAHEIRIIYSKADFAAALDTKDAIIIYDGHSRIGQGPAFGPASVPTCPDAASFPTNPWGDNFRMGFDLADIECVDDILKHGINPLEYSMPANSKGLFASAGLTDIVEKAIKAGKGKCSTPASWRSLSACHSKIAASVNCRGVASLSARHYWKAHKGDKDFDTLVAVGDADLKKTKLACGVLFMNSCSSKKHFYPALKRHKKAQKSDCVFFVTADVCSANTTEPFLKAVLAGKDPVKDAKSILKRMNALAASGFISLEK